MHLLNGLVGMGFVKLTGPAQLFTEKAYKYGRQTGTKHLLGCSNCSNYSFSGKSYLICLPDVLPKPG